MSLQSLGHVCQKGIHRVSRSVACFPAMGMVPPVSMILGVRYAYQPKAKQQRKGNVVPSYRIGVTQAWDSQHTGTQLKTELLLVCLVDNSLQKGFQCVWSVIWAKWTQCHPHPLPSGNFFAGLLVI